jgi:uncharacterized membrane-anchored protein
MKTNTRRMLNKVPEVTLYFWLIKILCTTVGETAADFLNDNVGLGLTNTTYIMAALLIAVLVFQFRASRYVPGIYWLAVVLISVVGTLITDNLVDNFGVALETTTTAFSIALAVTFAAWYRSERTLSIHSIVTRRREMFYWATVMTTFALGTAAGDLTARTLGLGWLGSGFMFAALIAVPAVLHWGFRLNAIAAFWFAYIVTRPLGASFADWIGLPHTLGGLGFGRGVVSLALTALIVALVAYVAAIERKPSQAAEGYGV